MASDSMRQDLVDQVREEQHKRQRAPRVHRVAVAQGSPEPHSFSPDVSGDAERAGVENQTGEAGDTGAVRKRRRRKRSGAAKTGGAGGGEGGGAPAN